MNLNFVAADVRRLKLSAETLQAGGRNMECGGLVTAFAALATCRQSRAASSGPLELYAFPRSTATSRLPKARTSPRTPKWLRLRGAVRIADQLVARNSEIGTRRPCRVG